MEDYKDFYKNKIRSKLSYSNVFNNLNSVNDERFDNF